MEILKNLTFLILLIVGILIFSITPFLLSIRPRRPKEIGFPYVYVNDDGSARELSDEEQKYLNTDFHGGDGARPYIKDHYYSLTPDGKTSGYLWRRHLPKGIEIEDSEPFLTRKY